MFSFQIKLPLGLLVARRLTTFLTPHQRHHTSENIFPEEARKKPSPTGTAQFTHQFIRFELIALNQCEIENFVIGNPQFKPNSNSNSKFEFKQNQHTWIQSNQSGDKPCQISFVK